MAAVNNSELLQIMSELTSNGIHIYQCPTDDETVAEVNTAMNVSSECLLPVRLCLLNNIVWPCCGSFLMVNTMSFVSDQANSHVRHAL